MGTTEVGPHSLITFAFEDTYRCNVRPVITTVIVVLLFLKGLLHN